ncbi:MAG: BlaI/MecI/CopY family transcriptional regulator [Ruminococcus sp.]|nr:BlaI/MecI/CopY family transcriptional regulator [Ruminococcus sp.]
MAQKDGNTGIKLFDSELKVMEILWEKGQASAKETAEVMGERVGWSKTTVYTVIKKLIAKGAVSRSEPGFVCRPLISREEVCFYETGELIRKMYGGRSDRLVASLLDSKRLTDEEIRELKKLIEELE